MKEMSHEEFKFSTLIRFAKDNQYEIMKVDFVNDVATIMDITDCSIRLVEFDYSIDSWL